MNKKKLLKFLKISGISVLSTTGIMCSLCEAQHQYFAQKGKELPLTIRGNHLEKGDHNYVLTNQACEMLSFETTQLQRDIAISGMKAACMDLDKYNSQLNLKLCTTNAEYAKEYDIPKVDKIGKQDIPIYITDKYDGTNMGKAYTFINVFNYKLNNMSITFRKKYLFRIYVPGDTLEVTLEPTNCISYPLFFHEAAHILGFGHIENRKSILNSEINIFRKLSLVTEEDKEMFDKYNVQFYGAEPTYVAPKLGNTEYTTNVTK